MTDAPTFIELLSRYPGGFAALARDSRVPYSTLRRVRLAAAKKTPWDHLRAVAKAKEWDQVADVPKVTGKLRAEVDRRETIAARHTFFVDAYRTAHAQRAEGDIVEAGTS